MDHIFISYRREDAADVTGRIHDRLRQHFGEDAIFTDVDKIPLGEDFRAHLDRKMSQCKVLLPVIGRNWLNAKDQHGRPRLLEPGDFVRLEIESALERDIPVIPLLVHGIDMPSFEDLPEPLQPLAFRNGTPIRRDPDFHKDMDRLISGLERYLQKGSDEKRPSTPADTPAAKSSDPELDPRVLSDLYTEGLAAFYTENWAKACEAFTQVAGLDPTYEDTAGKLDEARRQRRMSELYDRASSHRDEEDWGNATRILEKIAALDPGYRDVTERLEEARIRTSLQQLYAESRQLMRADKWRAALTVLERIRSIDRDYPDPDGIRESAGKALDAVERDRKLARWYAEAVRRIDAGDWPAALQALDSILKVDGAYRRAPALRAQVGRRLQESEDAKQQASGRERKLAAAYEDLLKRIEAGEYLQARKLIDAIESVDSHYQDLTAMKATVDAAIDQAHLFRTAIGFFQSGQWDEAIRAFEEIRSAKPDFESKKHGKVTDLLVRARREREMPDLPLPPTAGSAARPTDLPVEPGRSASPQPSATMRRRKPKRLPETLSEATSPPGRPAAPVGEQDARRTRPDSLPEIARPNKRPDDLPS